MKRFMYWLMFIGIFLASFSSTSMQTASTSTEHLLYLPAITVQTDKPLILNFQANVDIATPGDSIVLQWKSINATKATLYHLLPTLQFGQFWQVTPNGTFHYDINIYEHNVTRFALFVANDAGETHSATVEITLNCLDEWFFDNPPDICPAAAALISPAAEQHFEHGVMIWVAEEDRIYVLFDDEVFSPKWTAFADEWDVGEPIEDPSIVPPPGFYEPERGFGLVWREQPTIRDRLGWAVAPEVGFETAVQRTSYSRYNDTYILAQDGNLWRLFPEHSDWEKIFQ